MPGTFTTAFKTLIFSVSAPVSSAAPVTLRSLLSTADAAALGTLTAVQADVKPTSIDIVVRDDADTTNRAASAWPVAANVVESITGDDVLDTVFVRSSTTSAAPILLKVAVLRVR